MEYLLEYIITCWKSPLTGLLNGQIYITGLRRKALELALALFWIAKSDLLHLKKKTKTTKRSEGKQSLLACSFFQAC